MYHALEVTKAERIPSSWEDQGFLDEAGNYLNRKEALVNAKLFDQIKGPQKEIIGEELYSENLW